MVTKRQQLKWLAKRFESLPFDSDSILMSDEVLGYMGYEHRITNQELKRERDKMSSKPEVDNSWHARGEFPPAGAIVEKKCKSATIWTEIKIVAAGNQLVIFGYPAGDESVGEWSDYDFRPLSTEREKAIDEMDAALRNRGSAISDVILGELYDAGFRVSLDK